MQFTLLFKNMKILQTIMLADFFKPENSASDQLCYIIFGCPAREMDMEYQSLTKLDINQVIPNVDGKGNFYRVVNAIQELKMDRTVLVLSLVIGLMAMPDEEKSEKKECIEKIQKSLKDLLYRYSLDFWYL